MKIPDEKEINRGSLQERKFIKKWPEFYSFLMDNYRDCETLSEKLYLYYNGLIERPKCIVCGSDVKFTSFFQGFRKHCSCRCSRNNPESDFKRTQTNLGKYGVKNPLQNKSIKEKVKQTNRERYGVENPFSSDVFKEKIKQTNIKRYGFEYSIQNELVKEKMKQTNLERYGVKYGLESPTIREKIKQTNLERYGVENPFSSDVFKEKIKQTNLDRYGMEYGSMTDTVKEKIKQANLERYGVESVIQNESIREKIKQTNLERYGVEYASQNKTIKEKIKQTNLEKYGVGYPMLNDKVKEKVINKLKENSIESHPDLIRYDKSGDWVYKCPHPECNKCSEKEYVINQQVYYNRKLYGSELCTKLLPIQSPHSTPELQIRNFLDSLNIEYKTNDRSIIPPKELDIYIPSKKIAIEFNGSYWHSNKDKYYHQNKTKACYSKGILLIHIYEHEWDDDKESVLSKLKDVLEGGEVDGIVSVKDYNKYTLSEPVLIDCGSYKIWNEGKWMLKENL